VALVGRKVSEFFSTVNSTCGSFGAGRHQWRWLEGKFLNFFCGNFNLRKFWRWAAPVALVRRKASEFFPWKICPEEFFCRENWTCRSFGNGRHQWHWLEGKFMNFFSVKILT
jgi:hypothetical protein